MIRLFKYCDFKKMLLVFFYATIFLLLTNHGVFAVEIPDSQKISGVSYSSQESFFSSLYIWGVGVVGVLVFAQLIRGGIMYMVSGAVDTKKAAKDIITDALIGLTLALTSYLILNFINPEIAQVKEVTLSELKSMEYTDNSGGSDGSTSATTCMNYTTLQNYIDNNYTCETSSTMTCENSEAPYACIAPTSIPPCSIADSDSAACNPPTQFYTPEAIDGKYYLIGGSNCHPDYHGDKYTLGTLPVGCELIEYTP